MFGLPKLQGILLALSFASVFASKQKELKDEKVESLVPLRTHSIFAPYVDQDLQNRWFDFGGDAYVNTNKHIRLTQDRQSETGWLWSRLPITVTNYQIDVEFKIGGGSGHLFGDGMAIWITKTRATFGPVFGSVDNFEGVGIFLDTYANSRHSYSFPRIIGMIGDGRTSYDLGSDGDTNAAGACSASIRRNDIKTKVRIIYQKYSGLQVQLQYKGWDEWTPCFELKNLTLPSMPYLGFSAVTGEVHDAHDIISVSTHSIVQKPLLPMGSGKNSRPRPAYVERSWTWSGVFIKIFLFGGLCAGLYQAYIIYYVNGGRWSNKRF